MNSADNMFVVHDVIIDGITSFTDIANAHRKMRSALAVHFGAATHALESVIDTVGRLQPT